MKYLECLMMIKFHLQQLNANSRVPVSVDILHELNASVIDIMQKLADAPTTRVTLKLRSLQEALAVVKATPGMLFLTDKMKSVLVDEFKNLETEIQLVAFEYFKYNDFEPTEVITDLMREVVRTAALKGVI